jgi:hypothetical protein
MIMYEDDDIELKDDYEDSDIFRKAIPSQYQSVLYERLKKDKRLDDFIKVIKRCSLAGKTLKETCIILSQLFRGYVRDIGITPDMLNKMRNRYRDIDAAVSFSNDNNILAAYERAAKLAAKTEDMEEAIRFIDRFDNEGMFTGATVDNNKADVTVQVNNYSNQTKSTDDMIMQSLRAIELSVGRGDDNDGATEC